LLPKALSPSIQTWIHDMVELRAEVVVLSLKVLLLGL